jgi:hypothetical protein
MQSLQALEQARGMTRRSARQNQGDQIADLALQVGYHQLQIYISHLLSQMAQHPTLVQSYHHLPIN